MKKLTWLLLVALCLPGLAFAKKRARKPANAVCEFGDVPQPGQVCRPPQYVMLGFDGSLSLNFWESSRTFAKTMNSSGKPLGFTYFVSGVYWLTEAAKKTYIEPSLGPGRSGINWGGTVDEIKERVRQVNLANDEGHEIGSHAVAHFGATENAANGRKGKKFHWTAEQWTSEFTQLNELLYNVFTNVGFPVPEAYAPTGYSFPQESIVGFRAPLLEVTEGLWPTLREFNFRYDTSRINNMNYWPQPLNGVNDNGQKVWDFPLASLRIAESNRRTLSMDYNFKVAHDAVEGTTSETAYRQMYNTYVNYFNNNYNSNRAPLQIGHHFSRWYSGAYWRAMQDLAKNVCGRPEVRCVVYRKLADYMDSLPQETINAHQIGNFTKAEPVQVAAVPKPVAAPATKAGRVSGQDQPADDLLDIAAEDLDSGRRDGYKAMAKPVRSMTLSELKAAAQSGASRSGRMAGTGLDLTPEEVEQLVADCSEAHEEDGDGHSDK